MKTIFLNVLVLCWGMSTMALLGSNNAAHAQNEGVSK